MKTEKLFEHFTRLMPLWVVIAGVVGFLKPELYFPLKSYTTILFSLTMLGIGAVLDFEDFIPVVRKPHLVLLGTLTQFGVMPLAGFLTARMLGLPAPLLIGLVMAGSVPGAMASNVISYLAKADVAYSIALTSTSTLLSPLLTPLFVYLFARHVVHIDFWAMVVTILQMVIAPLVAGFILKQIFRKTVQKIKTFFPAFSTLFIAFICGLIIALNKDYVLKISLLIFLAIFIQNLAGLLSGYYLGGLYKFDKKRRRTLAIEVGMQNAGMGAVLSLKFFDSQTALVSAIFATWCVITASILAEVWKNSSDS